MNQKNAFSYIMWFVYSVAVCAALFVISGTLSKQAGYSMMVGYGVSGIWLTLCGLIVFLIHKLATVQKCTRESDGMFPLVAESLIVVLLFALGIFLRVRGLSDAGEAAAYYEVAKVAEGQSIPTVVHGAVYLYLQLLHTVFLIFGNRFLVGIWLQIALQMIAGFFCYRAVRKMAGVLTSLITLGFVMVGSMMVSNALILSPEVLFFTIFSIALYGCAGCVRKSERAIRCLLSGLLIAFVSYLDILGIVLLVVTIIGILQKYGQEDCSISGRIVGALCCCLSCCVGLILTLQIDAWVSGQTLTDVILAWWKVYIPSTFELTTVFNVQNISVEFLLLLLFMAIGIFSFWCSFEKERLSLWICFATMLMLLQCFGMTTPEVNGCLYIYTAFIILTGVGLTGMFDHGSITVGDKEKIAGKTVEEPAVRRDVRNPKVDEAVEMETEATAPEPPKVKFLENPMALPKKHVKKVLDFDRNLNDAQEDYDLPVDDNDDYDI